MRSSQSVPPPPLAASPLALFASRHVLGARPRLRAGADVVRVRAGVYADRALWEALPVWHRYLARVHAFALQHPDAVFAFEAAAALLGLPLFGEPRDIHVYDPGRARSRRFGDVAVHTSEDPKAIRVGALNVTSIDETTLDLVRVLPPAFALAVADAAVSPTRADATTVEDLADLAAGKVSRRGRAQVRWTLDRADGRAESPGESVSRAVIEWCGFEEPELQRRFHLDGYDDRVDFFFARRRVIGESDGYGKYEADDAATAVRNVIAEKTREDRLRRGCDGFARWDQRDAMRASPMARKLVAAGLSPRHPEQHAMLATLRRHPRSAPRT